MTENAHHAPNKWPLPSLLTLGMMALCIVLNRIVPNTWTGSGDTAGALVYLGIALVAAGIALDVWAFITFRRHHANIRPDRAATALIMDGPFAYSRNPIYLANVLLVAGIGFATDNRWMLLGGAVLYILLQELAIKREEKHMEAQFGARWSDYTNAVRRWV